jgi:3-oxoacyl-(acyl-carrier-protein) synthase
MERAVAITGMGVLTAQGVGIEATWAGVKVGRDALRYWTGAPGGGHALGKMKVAECPALPRPGDLPERLWRELSRTQQLACVAMDEALHRAKLPRTSEEKRPIGLFLATTVCGMDRSERFYEQYRVDRERADLRLMRRLQPSGVEELLRRRHRVGIAELDQVCLTTCVGSAMAIASACDAILLGECEVAIAGGSEALCRVVLSGFHSLKVVAADGCRPFDKNRPGITVGEGAGMLVLESAEHARARGAEALAYVRGVGITCDAHHITAPDPEARQAVRAMREALERAGVSAGDVDYINAHGTGTRDNDVMETLAIRTTFAECATPPPVSSTKRCTGHTFGAAGVIEAIVCVQAIREGIVPANAGSVEGDTALRIPVVRGESLRREVRAAMSTNFAFGGNNTAMVFSRESGES